MRRIFVHSDAQSKEREQRCFESLNIVLKEGQVSSFQDFELTLLDDAAYAELQEQCKQAAKLMAKHGPEAFAASAFAERFAQHDLMLQFTEQGAGISLCFQPKMSPLLLDFEHTAYRQRLLRGGRQKEAVARAVMQGLEDGALVFDATAGLGRESMILAHAGARIFGFERQLPVWIILKDALQRAQGSRYFPFLLPELQPLGTIKDYSGEEKPQVVYYDPMFPERENSALVKKEMFIFQQVIGHDEDAEDFLEFALGLAQKRVVVKRPSSAPVLERDGLKAAFSVDGGLCRFDCYTVL